MTLQDFNNRREELVTKLDSLKEARFPIFNYRQRKEIEKQLEQLDLEEKSAAIEAYIDIYLGSDIKASHNGYQVLLDGEPFLVGKDKGDTSDEYSIEKEVTLVARTPDNSILIKCKRSEFHCLSSIYYYEVEVKDTARNIELTLDSTHETDAQYPTFYAKTEELLLKMNNLIDPFATDS